MKPGNIFLILGALLFVHCAGTQQQAAIGDEAAPNLKSGEHMNEDFDPLSLGDSKIDIEPRKETANDIVTTDQLLRGGSAEDSVVSGRELPGFRVQLISTRDQEEARSMMRNAVISFSENVYREYANPYYKIRVGDFQSRYEASKLQEKAIKLGFPEAWVVRTVVWDGPPKKQAAAESNNDR